MNNKIKILILLTICFSTISLFSIRLNRPDNVRINQIVIHDQDNYGISNTISNYYYSSPNTALIDSIVTSFTSSIYPDSVTTYRYTHTFEQTGNLITKEYDEYIGASQIVNKHYKFVTDQDGKAIEKLITKSGIPIWYSYYNYNSANLPDSIYFMMRPGVTVYQSYRKLFYDNNNRLSYSIHYSDPDWQPLFKYTLNYSDNPLQYQTPLDFSNYMQYTLSTDYGYLFARYDRFYAFDSISQEMWMGQWSAYPHESYYVTTNGGNITIHNDNLYYSNSYFYTFNSQGLLIQTYYNLHSDVISSTTISWDDLVPNDDPTIPIPLKNLLVYPNPFTNNLNIKTASKKIINNDISIYNIKGQLVRSWKDVKTNELIWDGKDEFNQPVSSGIYLIKARQGNQISTAKVLKY